MSDMKEIEESVIEKIRSRRDVGRTKYGTTMERNDLSMVQWLQHAQEEAMDLAIYLEKAILNLSGAVPADGPPLPDLNNWELSFTKEELEGFRKSEEERQAGECLNEHLQIDRCPECQLPLPFHTASCKLYNV